MFSFEGTDLVPEENGTSLDSSMVEHAAVNRGVAGSSPARGAFRQRGRCYDSGLRGQEVKTSPFHGGNTGSIPVGVTNSKFHK